MTSSGKGAATPDARVPSRGDLRSEGLPIMYREARPILWHFVARLGVPIPSHDCCAIPLLALSRSDASRPRAAYAAATGLPEQRAPATRPCAPVGTRLRGHGRACLGNAGPATTPAAASRPRCALAGTQSLRRAQDAGAPRKRRPSPAGRFRATRSAQPRPPDRRDPHPDRADEPLLRPRHRRDRSRGMTSSGNRPGHLPPSQLLPPRLPRRRVLRHLEHADARR